MNDERHDPQAAGGQAGDAQAEGATEGATQGTTQGTTQGAAGASGTSSTTGKRTFVEEFQVSGERVVEKIKELIREGNVRRISLKNEKGETLIEIPLTIGVIGTLLLPVWAGIGAIAALVANLTISAEKVVQPEEAPPPAPQDEASTPA